MHEKTKTMYNSDVYERQLFRRGERVFASVDFRVLVRVVDAVVVATVMAAVLLVVVLCVRRFTTQASAEEVLPRENGFTVEVDPQAGGDADDEQEEVLGHVDEEARPVGPRRARAIRAAVAMQIVFPHRSVAQLVEVDADDLRTREMIRSEASARWSLTKVAGTV